MPPDTGDLVSLGVYFGGSWEGFELLVERTSMMFIGAALDNADDDPADNSERGYSSDHQPDPVATHEPIRTMPAGAVGLSLKR